MNDRQNIADYRLTLEGRDLGLGKPVPARLFGIDFGRCGCDPKSHQKLVHNSVTLQRSLRHSSPLSRQFDGPVTLAR